MDVSIPLFGVYLFVMVLASVVRPHWLMGAWAITVFLFPTTRTLVGPAPIYWFDLATVAVLSVLFYKRRFQWPPGMPQWHWWLVGYAALFGLVWPAVRYAPSAELVYVWLHTSLAWMAFPIGVLVAFSPYGERYRSSLAGGLLVALVGLAVLAVVQKGDPQGALAVNQIYRGDMGGLWTESTYGGMRYSARPNGPYGAATSFAGVACIVALEIALLRGLESKIWGWSGVALASVVTLLTLTRHVLVAAAVGVVVVVLTSSARQSLKALVLGSVVTSVFVAVGLGMGWQDRFDRTSGGVLTDLSITARVVEGPLRLAALIAAEPLVVVTGVGLDVQKIASTGVDVGIADSGFVSNGFVLPLYYLGIGGFVLTVGFWIWVYRTAGWSKSSRSGVLRGLVVAATVLVASDNYSFLDESAVAGLFLFAGCLVGQEYRRQSVRTHLSLQPRPSLSSPARRLATT